MLEADALKPLALPTALHAALLSEAAASPGVEVCGVVLGTGDRVDQLWPAANLAANPAQAFEIDPAALLAAHKAARAQGREVIGYYHSHPNGVLAPSAEDTRRAADVGGTWLIIADQSLAAFTWTASGFRSRPLALI
jgi:desampylase